MVGFHLSNSEVLFADWTDAILPSVTFLLCFFVKCPQTQSFLVASQQVFVDAFLVNGALLSIHQLEVIISCLYPIHGVEWEVFADGMDDFVALLLLVDKLALVRRANI